MTTPAHLKRAARGERPYFFDDPAVDKVVAMIMGLAGEVAVLRDRQDTLERLLESRNLISRGDIESYAPPPPVMAERAAWRESFLGEVLRIVEIELEAVANGESAPYEAAMKLVEDERSAP